MRRAWPVAALALAAMAIASAIASAPPPEASFQFEHHAEDDLPPQNAVINADAAALTALAARCRREAQGDFTVDADQLQRTRDAARRELERLVAEIPVLNDGDRGWGQYLLLAETRRLAAGADLTTATLDTLETRWINAPAVWDHPGLARAARAVRSCVQATRAASVADLDASSRTAWLDIAAGLESLPSASPTERALLEAQLGERAALGQGAETIAAIREALSGPNVVLHMPASWLQESLGGAVNEGYDVRGVYAGARTRGRGSLNGLISSEVRPTANGGELIVRFVGVASSRSVGTSSGVNVTSLADTDFQAEKRFAVHERGLTAMAATASATARVRYERVRASGGPLRRQRSIQAAYARRRQAERDTAAEVRRATTERLDAEGAAWAQRFNQGLRELCYDIVQLRGTVLSLRVRVARDALRWEAQVAPRDRVLITPPPPPPTADGMIVQIAASALQQRSNAVLARQVMTGNRLQQALGGGPTADAPALEASFGPQPCLVQLADDALTATSQVERLMADGVTYPPLSVALRYALAIEDGRVALVRSDRPRVRILADGGGAERASGRATALRLSVERKLDRALAQRVLWDGFELTAGSPSLGAWPIALHADDQWLTIVFGAKPAQALAAAAIPTARPASAAGLTSLAPR